MPRMAKGDDYCTFITKSGLNGPIPAMAIPDLAVPYAAPAQPKIMADAMPAMPMNGAKAWVGAKTDDMV